MKENIFRVYCEFEFEGKLEKCMESPASWFLMTQTGKLWTYDPGEIPRPLEKEYKKAIPLFYTGLKDKNGKEIYEGDLIQVSDIGIAEIVYGFHVTSKDDWSVEHGTMGFTLKWAGTDDYSELQPSKEFEIIGNIYENPELLERK